MTRGQGKGARPLSLIPGVPCAGGMGVGAHLPEHVLGFLQVKLLSCKKSRGKRLEARSRASYSLKTHEEMVGCLLIFLTPQGYNGGRKSLLKCKDN